MIILFRKFGRQRYKAGVKVDEKLKDLTCSNLIKMQIQSFRIDQRSKKPIALLSEALKKDFVPLQEAKHKKIDTKRLSGMIKSQYNQIISRAKSDIIKKQTQQDKRFMDISSRQAIQNALNHQEWRQFKKQLFQKKQSIRLLKCQIKNPLNYLPSNMSQQSLRFKRYEQNNQKLAQISIQQTQLSSQPNKQLSNFLKQQIFSQQKGLIMHQTQNKLQKNKNIQKVIDILQANQNYKNWLLSQKYRHLIYQVKGRMQFKHLNQEQFKKYLWLDVSQPGQILHILCTNQLSFQKVADAYIRLSSFPIQLAQQTRMQSTIEYRKVLKGIFTNLFELDNKTLCQVVHSLGKSIQFNLGMQWPNIIRSIMKSIVNEIYCRQFNNKQIVMLLTGIKKMPKLFEQQIQTYLLNLVKIKECQLYQAQQLAQYICGITSTPNNQKQLLQLLQIIIYSKQNWYSKTLMSAIYSLSKLASNAIKSQFTKAFLTRLLKIPQKIYSELTLQQLSQVLTFLNIQSIYSNRLTYIITKYTIKILRQKNKNVDVKSLSTTIIGLAQYHCLKNSILYQNKNSINVLTIPYAIFIPNSAQYIPFIQAASQLLLPQNKDKVSSILISRVFLGISKLKLSNYQIIDNFAVQLIQSIKQQQQPQWTTLSNILVGYYCSKRIPQFFQQIQQILQICIQKSRINKSIINPINITNIISSLAYLKQNQSYSLISSLFNLIQDYINQLPDDIKLSLQFGMFLVGRNMNFTYYNQFKGLQNLFYSIIKRDKQWIQNNKQIFSSLIQNISKVQPSLGQCFSYQVVIQQIRKQIQGQIVGPCVLNQSSCILVSSWSTLIYNQKQQKYQMCPLFQKIKIDCICAIMGQLMSFNNFMKSNIQAFKLNSQSSPQDLQICVRWMKANLQHNQVTVVIKKQSQIEELSLAKFVAKKRGTKRILPNNQNGDPYANISWGLPSVNPEILSLIDQGQLTVAIQKLMKQQQKSTYSKLLQVRCNYLSGKTQNSNSIFKSLQQQKLPIQQQQYVKLQLSRFKNHFNSSSQALLIVQQLQNNQANLSIKSALYYQKASCLHKLGRRSKAQTNVKLAFQYGKQSSNRVVLSSLMLLFKIQKAAGDDSQTVQTLFRLIDQMKIQGIKGYNLAFYHFKCAKVLSNMAYPQDVIKQIKSGLEQLKSNQSQKQKLLYASLQTLNSQQLIKSYDYKGALICSQQAYNIRVDLIGQTDQQTCNCGLICGQSLFMCKQYQQALKKYKQLRKIEQQRYKVNRSKIAHLSYNIGSILCQLKKFDEAQNEYKMALNQMSIQGSNHAFETKVKSSIATVFSKKQVQNNNIE